MDTISKSNCVCGFKTVGANNDDHWKTCILRSAPTTVTATPTTKASGIALAIIRLSIGPLRMQNVMLLTLLFSEIESQEVDVLAEREAIIVFLYLPLEVGFNETKIMVLCPKMIFLIYDYTPLHISVILNKIEIFMSLFSP